MSRTHGWKPKPKFTCGLNVSDDEWQRIFGKKNLSGGPVAESRESAHSGGQRDMDLIQKPVTARSNSLTDLRQKSKASS